MDWFDWIICIAVGAGIIGTVILAAKGYLTNDTALVIIRSIIKVVREAETRFPEPGKGAEKKRWALAQLRTLGEKYDAHIFGILIDAVVALLNRFGWAT